MHSTDHEYFADAEAQQLSGDARAVVDAVGGLLNELDPAGTCPAKTVVMREGESCDLVIEHGSFPGLVLAVGVGPGRASLYWAQHTDVAWKDELDAARTHPQVCAAIRANDASSLADFLVAVRRQLAAPLEHLEVSVSGRPVAEEIWLPETHDVRGARRCIWVQRSKRLRFSLRRETRQVGVVSFVDAESHSRPTTKE